MNKRNLKNKVRITIYLIICIILIGSSVSYSQTIDTNEISYENEHVERVDIGEIENQVYVELNEETLTYEIRGAGKISRDKFKEYLKAINNSEEYTIEIMSNETLLPDNSELLFSINDVLQTEDEEYDDYFPTESLLLKIVLPNNLDTSNVYDMSGMFYGATSANPDVSNWDTSNVVSMKGMFWGALKANPDVSRWNTSRVRHMGSMFDAALEANPDVSNWDTSNVTNMSLMFVNTHNANPDVSRWNTSNVTNMFYMFAEALNANPDVSNWDVSNVTDMRAMFSRSNVTNIDVSRWDVRKVNKLEEIFYSNFQLSNTGSKYWELSSLDDEKYKENYLRYILIYTELDNLTDTQKNILSSELDSLTERTKLEEFKLKLIDLDNKMIDLKQKVKELESFKNENDYSKLSEEEKAKAEELIIKSRDEEETKTKEKVELLISEIDKILNKSVPGIKRLLKNRINEEMSNLSEAQKELLINELEQINSKSEVELFKIKAEELNSSMNNLNSEKTKLEEFKNSIDFNKLSIEDKNKIEEVLSKLNDINNISTKEKVEELTREIEEVLNSSREKARESDSSKEETTNSINNDLGNLTNEQKESLLNELEKANTKEEIEAIRNKAQELNLSMNRLNVEKEKLLDFKNSNEFNKIPEDYVEEIEKILLKIESYNNILEVKKIDDLINEISKLLEKAKLEILELSNYRKYLDIFNYDDISIINNFKEKVYFNFSLGKSLKEISEELINEGKIDSNRLIGGIDTGINIGIINDVSLGGFLSYDKNKSHHISVGLNVLNNHGLGFIRYRLSTIDSLISHSVDMYGRYLFDFVPKGDFIFSAGIGTYLSYSSAVDINERVRLDPRVIFYGDTEFNIGYKGNGLEFNIRPMLKVGYEGSVLVDKKNTNNKYERFINSVIYKLNVGARKEFYNGLSVKGDVTFRGNEKGQLRFKGNVGLGYKW